MTFIINKATALSLLLTLAIGSQAPRATKPPSVGDTAPDFVLSTIDGKRVRLSELTADSKVVLLVLRGYPGYQCPLCNLQVRDYIKNSDAFRAAKSHVVLVYPAKPDDTSSRSAEFISDKKLPDNFTLLLDPGYEFTNLYGLRWDAPNETAYPATFLIDSKRRVFYSKVSTTHGGRTKASEVLEVLAKP